MKGTGSHPLPSRCWRPQFSEQHSQCFTQLEPVAGGVGEQESALRNKASILNSSSASRLFSCRSCSVSFLSCAISLSSCYGFAGLRLHPLLVLNLALPVLHLALLVAGIPSPVEHRQPEPPPSQR
jgi:hypothetical protein